ncbi:MAG: FRG domain-containing protein [Chitinophagaceae bacterium]|nr:FRG domain-containing protein [Chitinophagaceae bacterium]
MYANTEKKLTEIETTTISTLSEFISYVETKCLGEYMLFRGQSQDWDLLPKISRILPKKGTSILDMETRMLDDFKRLSKPFLKNIPTNEWEWLGLAQHHGLSTRLLNWSKSTCCLMVYSK